MCVRAFVGCRTGASEACAHAFVGRRTQGFGAGRGPVLPWNEAQTARTKDEHRRWLTRHPAPLRRTPRATRRPRRPSTARAEVRRAASPRPQADAQPSPQPAVDVARLAPAAPRHLGRPPGRRPRARRAARPAAHRRPVHGRAPRARARAAEAPRRAGRRAPRVPEGARRSTTTTAATSPPFEELVHRRPEPADQVGRAVGPLRRRRAAPRHRVPPRDLPARHHVAEGARRVRDDRDRARFGCRGDRHDRDVRRGQAAVRDQHAVPRRVEGLPRQRRACTAPRPSCSRSSSRRASTTACTPSTCRSATPRAGSSRASAARTTG